jgi:hypothetical protein
MRYWRNYRKLKGNLIQKRPAGKHYSVGAGPKGIIVLNVAIGRHISIRIGGFINAKNAVTKLPSPPGQYSIEREFLCRNGFG